MSHEKREKEREYPTMKDRKYPIKLISVKSCKNGLIFITKASKDVATISKASVSSNASHYSGVIKACMKSTTP